MEQTLSKKLEDAKERLNDLHYKRYEGKTKMQLDYLLAEINNTKEAPKLEKALKKVSNEEWVNVLKKLSFQEKQQKYIHFVQDIFDEMAQKNEVEGPIKLQSSTLKKMRDYIACVNTKTAKVQLKETDKDKEKTPIDTTLFNKEFKGQKGKYFCFQLKVKKEHSKEVKHDEYLFGSVIYKEALKWFRLMGGEFQSDGENQIGKNESDYRLNTPQKDENSEDKLRNQTNSAYYDTSEDTIQGKNGQQQQQDQNKINNQEQQQQQQQLQQLQKEQKQEKIRIKKKRQIKKVFKVPYIFESYYSEFQFDSAQDETGYKCVEAKQNQRILQNNDNSQLYKLILSIKGSVREVFQCIVEPEYFQKSNSNIQEIKTVDFMRPENSSIIYQKHKSVGTFYKSREFTYMRFVIPNDENSILIFDKSISYEMPGGYTVQEGKINSAIWLLAPHPDDQDITILTLQLDIDNQGYGKEDSSISLAYLQGFENMGSYINQFVSNQSEKYIPVFDIKLYKQEEYYEEVYQDKNSLTQIREEEDESNPSALRQNQNNNSNNNNNQQVNNSNNNIENNQESTNDLDMNQIPSDMNLNSNNELDGNNIKKSEEEVEAELARYSKNQQVIYSALHNTQRRVSYSEQEGEDLDKLFKMAQDGTFQHLCLNYNAQMAPIPLKDKSDYPQIQSNGESGNYVFHRDWRRDEKTGQMLYVNEEIIARQKKVAKFLLKTMGGNLLQGKSLLSTSMPVYVFDKRSNLERMAYSFTFAPIYLEAAALLSDPVEQMKQCTAFLITTTLMYLELQKPYNPILGETYQGTIKGCPIYMEQTSHHPPILNFQLIGRGYTFEGYMESIANMHANSFDGHNFGEIKIKFKNTQNEIILMQPTGTLYNTVMGSRYFNFEGRLYALDKKNMIVMETQYNPDKKGTFSLGKQKSTIDNFRGGIYRVTQSCLDKLNSKYSGKNLAKLCGSGLKDKDDFAKQLANIEGIWSKYIEIDGKIIYHIEDGPFPYKLQNISNPLPSDCNFREDIILHKKEDETGAQEWKEVLEVKQRQDKKLRVAYQKQQKKKK